MGLQLALDAVGVEINKTRSALQEFLVDNSPTNRQNEVIALIRAGKSDKEIGAILNISVRTAKYHVSGLLKRYNVQSRYDLRG
jgi:DNA-binding NarL/FixJ family response regulator